MVKKKIEIRSIARPGGLSAKIVLPNIKNDTEWTDIGLIFGSGFKNYQSRNVFPESNRSRILHPQEKSLIEGDIIRQKLFVDSSFQLPIKKKILEDQK